MGNVGIPGKLMRNCFPPGVAGTITSSHFLVSSDFGDFYQGLRNSQEDRSPGEYAAGRIRSLEGFDLAHSTATGPPIVSVTAGGGQSSGSTPGRRPMIRMLPDRKTVTARHPYQG